MKAINEDIGKNLVSIAKKTSQLVMKYSILIVGCVIILALIIWTSGRGLLKQRNCANMDALTTVMNKNNKIGPLKDKDCNRKLKDFYIKTAYNCCCAGNFKNDFVSLCALKNCISQGVRCLDFEIYSVNDMPVVCASSVNNKTIKETYNSIPFEQVVSTLVNNALGESAGTTCPNPEDPLILHLRIMSDNVKIYNKIAKIFSGKDMSQYMLGPSYSYQFSGGGGGVAKNAGAEIPIIHLRKKIFIMIDAMNEKYPVFEKTGLAEYVNLATNTSSGYAQTKRFLDIKNTPDLDKLMDYNKKGITVCIPDLNPIATNYPYNIPMVKGCQMNAMCFQSNDPQLHAYTSVFNEKGLAFIIKPEDYLEKIICIPKPSEKKPTAEPITAEAPMFGEYLS